MTAEYMTGGGRRPPKGVDLERWSINLDIGVDTDGKIHGDASLNQDTFYRSSVDEVVIGDWLHLENLGDNLWHLRIGDQTYTILPDRTLRPDTYPQGRS